MIEAKSEISHYPEFDYVIINDDFDRAVLDLKAIIRCQRIRLEYQQAKFIDLLTKLLA